MDAAADVLGACGGGVDAFGDLFRRPALLIDGGPVLRTPKGDPVKENRYYPSPEMHEEAARRLAPEIRKLLETGPDQTATEDVLI